MYHFLLPPPSNSVMSVMKRIPYSKSNMDQNWFFWWFKKTPTLHNQEEETDYVSFKEWKNSKQSNERTKSNHQF